MQDDESIYDAIGKGFHEAEDVLHLLHARCMRDGEQMSSTNEGMQTVGDLRELVTNGIQGLCQRMDIPAFNTAHIFSLKIVSSWLEEIALKMLLFMLLTMGKGTEALNMQAAIDARFGKAYSAEIAGAALFLAEQMMKASQRRDFDQMTEIMRGLFVASPKLEEYHKQFS
jgi:hypothetical protein